MKHCKKMVLKEYSSDEEDVSRMQIGRGDETMESDQPKAAKNSIRAHALNRQRKILTIIRKLAKIDAYNEHGQIKTKNGTFLERSDIATLVLWAVSQDKIIHGLQEFVELLKTAGVTSDEVMNENLRIRLGGVTSSIPISKPSEPIVVQENPQPVTTETTQQEIARDDVGDDYGDDDGDVAEEASEERQQPVEVAPKRAKLSSKEAIEGQVRTVRFPRKAKPYDRKYGKGFDVSDSE